MGPVLVAVLNLCAHCKACNTDVSQKPKSLTLLPCTDVFSFQLSSGLAAIQCDVAYKLSFFSLLKKLVIIFCSA